MDNNELAKALIKIAKDLVSEETVKVAAKRYKVGDLVKFIGARKVYKVIRENTWGGRYTYELKATTGGKANSYAGSVDPEDIIPADESAIPLDKKKRTALEAAKEELGKKVVVSYYRIVSETYGEVKGITKSGRIKVQLYHGGNYDRNDDPHNQEHFTPNKKTKGEVVQFSPQLWRGEWTWENKKANQYIKGKYKGGTLTQLLD